MLDPFLNSGFNLDILLLSGTVDKEIDRFSIYIIGRASSEAPSFKNRPEMLSMPTAFEMLIEESNFSVYSLVTRTREKFLS